MKSTFKVYIGKSQITRTQSWARAIGAIYENLDRVVESGYAKIIRDDTDTILVLDLDLPIKDHPR